MEETKKTTYDIIADAVRNYWKKTYVQDVIAFFYQKYDFESDDEWVWHEEYIYPQSSYDYETVNFQTDFCEGQTCVKNLVIVSFDHVTAFFTANHFEKKKTDELISRQAVIDELKRISFSHLFECGEYLSEDTREIEIINSRKAFGAIDALPSVQTEKKTGQWIYTNTIGGMRYYGCTNCAYQVRDCIADENEIKWYNYCPNCGAKILKNQVIFND